MSPQAHSDLETPLVIHSRELEDTSDEAAAPPSPQASEGPAQHRAAVFPELTRAPSAPGECSTSAGVRGGEQTGGGRRCHPRRCQRWAAAAAAAAALAGCFRRCVPCIRRLRHGAGSGSGFRLAKPHPMFHNPTSTNCDC